MKLTREIIEKAVKDKGYLWFEKGDYNLNIVGVRNHTKGMAATNLFDDYITISYKELGEWKFYAFKATTEPSPLYLKNPLNKKGTAILKPMQHRNSHSLGLHAGQYEALRQVGELKVYRDDDRDADYDYINEASSFNDGINIHRASATGESIYIEKWSAGCQVIANVKDWNLFLSVVKKSAALYGGKFTYTLITTDDLL
jgi:hypothetical protein